MVELQRVQLNEIVARMGTPRVVEVEGLAQARAVAARSADLVVLANLNVPVEEWLALFGAIGECAKKGAVALVLADQAPSVYPNNVLILERAEWEALVGEVGERRDVEDGRALTAFTIPVDKLVLVGADQLGRALAMVAMRCLNEVRNLGADARGKHALYATMHLNATLASATYPAPPAPRRRHRDTF